MTSRLALIPVILAAIASYLLTPLVRAAALRIGAVDLPSPRKVHESPMPRLGGLAVIVAAGIAYAVGQLTGWLPFEDTPDLWGGLGAGLIPVVLVSVLDDLKPMAAIPKLLAHALGAALAVWGGITLGPVVHVFGIAAPIGVFAAPISFVWLIAITNAFNIVDGLDGLAAGLAIIAAGSLGAVFVLVQQPVMAAATFVLAAALAGFLPYNIYPARIFLGDSGSAAIGFTLACFALRGGSTLSAGFATLLPVLMLGLPIAETSVSIVRRTISKLNRAHGGVFHADRNHFHHRLLALGIEHRHAVLILYAIGLVLAACSFVSVLMTVRQAAFLLAGLLLAGILGVARLGYHEFAVIRSGAVLKFYEAPVLKKSMFVVFADVTVVTFAVFGAIALKYDDWTFGSHRATAVNMIGALVPIGVFVFSTSGLYRRSWKLANIEDFLRTCRAVTVTAVSAFLLIAIVFRETPPASLFIVSTLLHMAFAIGGRMSYRALLWHRSRTTHAGAPALIYGAGMGGASALRELQSNHGCGMRPVGFIDDDPTKARTSVGGVPVLGSLSDLRRVLLLSQATAVVVSSPSIDDAHIAIARDICTEMGARLMTMEIRFHETGVAEEQLARA